MPSQDVFAAAPVTHHHLSAHVHFTSTSANMHD